MKIEDFNLYDFKDAFQVNEDFEIITGEYQDLKYITVDNFFLYPEKVVEILKHTPINDRTKVIEDYKRTGVDIYENPSLVQYLSSIALEPISYMYYKILSEEDFIHHSYDPMTESEQLGAELTQFVYYSNIFHPKMNHISHNYMPHFDKFQYVSSMCLSETTENTGISFYTLEHEDQSYQSIENIMNIDSLETKSDIRDRLNSMHTPDYEVSKYYNSDHVEKNGLFKKYFTIPCEYNKLIIYPGIFWHAAEYNSEVNNNIRYTFNAGYTPTDNL